MSKGSAKLIFFCQLCNAPIDSNICKVHGIDFVTIKKIYDDGPRRQTPQPGTNGAASVNTATHGNSSPETRLARPEGIPGQEYLPAVPGDIEDAPTEHLPALPGDIEESFQEQAGPSLPVVDEEIESESFSEELEMDATEFQQGEAPFKQMDPEVPEYYEQVGNVKKAPAKSNFGKIIGAFVAIVAIVGIAAAAYFFVLKTPASPDAMYRNAETQMAQGNRQAALSLYQELVSRFPNDPLASMAQSKITQIQSNPVTTPPQETTPEPEAVPESTPEQPAGQPAVVESGSEEIRDLMLKANVAFRKEQYAQPKGDNASDYVTSVLTLDPEYKPAIELKNQLVTTFNTQVDEALQDGNRMGAISALRNIHALTQDPKALDRILEILSEN
ncbi:MAG TPA: hypothetical protein PLG66_10415 [Calditrichia bacterium]|nr:hypothetical protein [Calditrichia bacterium]